MINEQLKNAKNMGEPQDYSNQTQSRSVLDSQLNYSKDSPESSKKGRSLGRVVELLKNASSYLKDMKDKGFGKQKAVISRKVSVRKESPAVKGLKKEPRTAFTENNIKELNKEGLLRKKGDYVKVGEEADSSFLGGIARKTPFLGEQIKKIDKKRYLKEAEAARKDLQKVLLQKQQAAFGWKDAQTLDLKAISLSDVKDKLSVKPDDLRPLKVIDDNIMSKDCHFAKKGQLLIIPHDEIDDFKITVNKSGQLIWKNEILVTSKLLGVEKKPGEEVLEDAEFKIVMDKKGNIYGVPDSADGPYRNKVVVHSCLATEDWPVAAGNIHTDKNGKLVYLDNTSGHFCPMEQNLRVMANILKEKNAISSEQCEIKVVASDSEVANMIKKHPRTECSFDEYREKVLTAAPNRF